jgi:hypothetical protein
MDALINCWMSDNDFGADRFLVETIFCYNSVENVCIAGERDVPSIQLTRHRETYERVTYLKNAGA